MLLRTDTKASPATPLLFRFIDLANSIFVPLANTFHPEACIQICISNVNHFDNHLLHREPGLKEYKWNPRACKFIKRVPWNALSDSSQRQS